MTPDADADLDFTIYSPDNDVYYAASALEDNPVEEEASDDSTADGVDAVQDSEAVETIGPADIDRRGGDEQGSREDDDDAAADEVHGYPGSSRPTSGAANHGTGRGGIDGNHDFGNHFSGSQKPSTGANWTQDADDWDSDEWNSDESWGRPRNSGSGIPPISTLMAYRASQQVYGNDNAEPGSSSGPSNTNDADANSLGGGQIGRRAQVPGDRDRDTLHPASFNNSPEFDPFTRHNWNSYTNPSSTSEILGFEMDHAAAAALHDEDNRRNEQRRNQWADLALSDEEELSLGLRSMTIKDSTGFHMLRRSLPGSAGSPTILQFGQDLSMTSDDEDDEDDFAPRYHWEKKDPQPGEWWKY